jgi:hypothetical protein
MTSILNQTGPVGVADLQAYLNRFSGLLIALVLVLAWPTLAQEERDAEFTRIYHVIQQGDALEQSGQSTAALAKYRQAHAELENFRKANAGWNSRVVSFRLNYLVGKVTALEKSSTGAAQGSATNAVSEARASASQVKLLEAGAEPRAVLRLHPKAGDKQKLETTLKMDIGIKVAEMESPPMKMPAMKMTLELTIQSVSPQGDIAYEIVATDASATDEPGVMPQVAEALKASLAGMKGASGKGTFSSRGLNKGTEFKLPAGADPKTQQTSEQLKEAFSNFAVPLPEEAVGPGAKWEFRMPVKSQGITIDQIATYQLVSVESDRVITKSTIAQRAANQKISNPAMPGLKLDLTKMTGTGSGGVTFDLSRLAPLEGTMESQSDFSMAMNTGDQKQSMTMKLNLNVRIEAK